MNAVADDALQLIADSAGDALARLAGPAQARRVHEGAPVTDAPAWRALAGLGWLGIPVPENAGGLGLGAPALAVVAEAAGRSLLTAPLSAAWASARLLASAGAAGAGALDALLGGAAVHVPAAVTRGADGRWQAALVPDAAVASAWLLWQDGVDAQAELRLLRADAPGVRRHDQVAVDGSLLCDLAVDAEAWAAAPCLLHGAHARAAWAEARALAWLADAALLAGTADAALQLALDYLRLRRQFGVPIGSFQALQHRAADLHVDLTATRALVHEAARAFDGERGQWAAAAAVLRAAATAQRIGEETVQFHGGIGFADEHDAGLYLRRAMTVGVRHAGEAMARLRGLPQCVPVQSTLRSGPMI